MSTTAPSAAPKGSILDVRERLIVALDFPDAEQALTLVDRLEDSVRWYKVGLELYLSAGNSVVQTLVRHGFSVFLDLKLHDIPNTVDGAVKTAGKSGASLLTIHASGGPAMVEAAARSAATLENPPKLLAVTVLTSMDRQQLEATGISATTADQVQRLAQMSIEAGADGLVCSAQESVMLRGLLGPGPLLVTPGIRPADADKGDQKRVVTPEAALRNGASYLVVGRPITQSADPRAAAESILAGMAGA